MTTWGIHCNEPDVDFDAENVIAIGWDELGDLREIGDDREALKARLAERYPNSKPGALAIWAGIARRFAYEMQPGDVVIHPIKKDSTVLIGRITGDYEWAQNAPSFRHRRAVEWLVDQPIPRIEFSEAARFEIGSALTMFKVKNHSDEFLARIGLAPSSPEFAAGTIPDDEVLADSEDALSAVRIQQDTSDFILARLLQAFSPREFEFFVSDLLNAAGYTARATQESGDGGIDVIAHRDPLGLEPPVIKVQVKRTTAPIGGPAVQQLTGALASGSNELGLFVTLGGFTKDAVHIERQRQDLRLVDGPALVEMLLDNYDRLPANIRTKIPLTRVFAVDREALSVS